MRKPTLTVHQRTKTPLGFNFKPFWLLRRIWRPALLITSTSGCHTPIPLSSGWLRREPSRSYRIGQVFFFNEATSCKLTLYNQTSYLTGIRLLDEHNESAIHHQQGRLRRHNHFGFHHRTRREFHIFGHAAFGLHGNDIGSYINLVGFYKGHIVWQDIFHIGQVNIELANAFSCTDESLWKHEYTWSQSKLSVINATVSHPFLINREGSY